MLQSLYNCTKTSLSSYTSHAKNIAVPCDAETGTVLSLSLPLSDVIFKKSYTFINSLKFVTVEEV